MDRVILISANPNQLHIYDPIAQSDQTVALAGAPLDLSLTPDGTHAAVAFANAVAYVDLQNASVSKTFSNIAVGTGKVICGAGYLYVFTVTNYQNTVISIDISSGQATTGSTFFIDPTSTVFDPALNAIYATQGGSPDSLNRLDTSGGVMGSGTAQPSRYFDVFNICGPVWLSHDGATIYSGCGPVYQASADTSQDMRYLGALPGVNGSQSLATSDSLGQIAIIPAVSSFAQTAGPLADTVVNLYASDSFNPVGQFATTPFHVNSTDFAAHGRWVFYNSSSSAMFLITQADSSAGLVRDYAIENINLANPNSCNATFASTSASAIAAGSYANAPIVSGEDCLYTAVSNAQWITLASGYYGSGSAGLTYLVRPNLSASLRSGTISLGSETFTVNQDAAGPASPLTPLSFKPIAADYDNALDKIITVSASPNELHIYDPVTQADQTVSLPYIPLSVAVRPDGLFAAVGYSGRVSVVDLQSRSVSQTIPIDMDNGGIALANNGYLYAFPSQTNNLGSINSVQLSTSTVTPLLQDSYYGNVPRVDASGNYLFVGSLGEGGSVLDISNGPAKFVDTISNQGGNIWLSQDGNRFINSNGYVFFTSLNPAQYLQPDGELTAFRVDWAADSQIQQRIAVLADPPFSTDGSTPNAQLQIYAANGLQLESQTAMPSFSNGGKSYVSQGRYVFWNAAASKLFAITEADSSSGLLSDYAIYTVDAPQNLPGCTYSVSPSFLNVPPSFSSSVFNVTSNCAWTATKSSASWLTPLSYGSVSGYGQLTVNVQSNSGAARSGTVAIGNQTVTINQAAGTCSYALSLNNPTFSQSGGTGQVNLSTGTGCSWSVQSNSPWLTVTSSQSGSGPAVIQFSVAPNPYSGVGQYGSLNIGGVPFSVIQTSAPAPGIPELKLSSTALYFNVAKVLTPGSLVEDIILSNPTIQSIPLGTVSITGVNASAFSASNNCGGSVAPGTTCLLTVHFSPLVMGDNMANINIPVAADGTKASVPLRGFAQLSGAVEIISMPTGKVLEVPDGSTADGTLIAQNALNGFQQQQWLLVPTGDGYYVIKNALTGKVLDVIGGDKNNGALVQQYEYLEGRNQQWRLQTVDGVHYAIINRQSGLVLDVRDGLPTDGALIQQWAYLGDPQQLWVIEPIATYNIANTLSSYLLDMTGGSTSNGALLEQWRPDGGRKQQWQFIPIDGDYFAIMNRNSGKVLDVTGGSTENGALLQQWDYLGGPNQQWQIVALDSKNYKIVNRRSGYVLDDTGFSIATGTPIQQWAYSGNKNQQWQIAPVTYYNILNRNSGLVLDVVDGAMDNGARVQQWHSNGSQQQQWQLVQTAQGTSLMVNNKSGKVLDVSSGSTTNGTPLQQWDNLYGSNQQWQTIFSGAFLQLKNASSQKVLDIAGGSANDGALLQQWDNLGGTNQQWQLVQLGF